MALLISQSNCLTDIRVALVEAGINVVRVRDLGTITENPSIGSIDGKIKEVNFSIKLRQVSVGSVFKLTITDKVDLKIDDYEAIINLISQTLGMKPMSIQTDDTKMVVAWSDNSGLIN